MSIASQLFVAIFAAIGFLQSLIPSAINADEPQIVYVESERLLSAPPRQSDQKYFFTRKHFPAESKEARNIVIANAVLEDGCFRLISECTALREIVLQETNLGDAELAQILSGVDCEYLNVMATDLTDSSVPALARETSLKKLFIWNTAITNDGVRKLKSLRPDLKINP